MDDRIHILLITDDEFIQSGPRSQPAGDMRGVEL